MFHNYIQALACGKMTIAEFDQYFCAGVNAKVIVNGEDPVRFVDFNNEIKGSKKIKIESVIVGRDKDGCVKNLLVNYDKKGWVSRNPCK